MSATGTSGAGPVPRDRSSDPRTIITPDAFSVHPNLLGIPLAQHSRRVVAILVDLVIIGLISQAGGLLLGLLAAVFLLRATFKRKDADTPTIMGTAFRGMVGCFGAVTLLVTVVLIWGALSSWAGGPDPAEEASSRAAVVQPDRTEAPAPGPGEEGEEAPEQTPEEEDPGEAGPDTAELPPALADSLRALEERLDEEAGRRSQAERALGELEGQVAEARETTGIRGFLRRIAEDLGIGFGWGALYFTFFTTWWRGRTPGKRLLGIRVVRLTGQPLTWWDSFERYGGYAAGFATGLLGFIQVYWDPNRQAIHDRIGRTVVIQDGRPPVPGRWHADPAAGGVRPRTGGPDTPASDPQERT